MALHHPSPLAKPVWNSDGEISTLSNPFLRPSLHSMVFAELSIYIQFFTLFKTSEDTFTMFSMLNHWCMKASCLRHVLVHWLTCCNWSLVLDGIHTQSELFKCGDPSSFSRPLKSTHSARRSQTINHFLQKLLSNSFIMEILPVMLPLIPI